MAQASTCQICDANTPHGRDRSGAGTFAGLPDGAASRGSHSDDTYTHAWIVLMDADGGMEPSRRGSLDTLRDGDAVLRRPEIDALRTTIADLAAVLMKICHNPDALMMHIESLMIKLCSEII